MFGLDRYYPSVQGRLPRPYTVLPSVCGALRLRPEPRAGRAESINLAAARAAEEPGGEVFATRVADRATRPYGRWVTTLGRRFGTRPDDARTRLPSAAKP